MLSFGQKETDPAFRFFEVGWANDFIFQTDYYYSNGLNLAIYTPFFEKSPLNFIMLPNGKSQHVWYALTITQDFFTPRNTFNEGVNYYDRPYASYLLVGHRKVVSNAQKQLKWSSEIQVGMLGKFSGGRSIQNGIHNILPTSKPALGWENQIASDLAINYSAQIEKGYYINKNLLLVPSATARLGIPYTDLSGGFQFRAGRFHDYFSSLGVNRNKDWELYAFADLSGRVVAYNATLQGGLFNESPHTLNTINPFVSDVSLGFVWSLKGFTFEYGQHLVSPEFKGGRSHKWGYISFKIMF